MPTNTTYKIQTKKRNLFLRIAKGHFAASHSHINYYIDVTTQKTRLSEAKAVAHELISYFRHNTIVDTILCLDETEVIGACLADELTREDFVNMNAHQTIYVLPPEYSSGQMIFRDNTVQMIKNKHVLILAASVATGNTARAAIEAVKYYGGNVVGISSIFATCDSFDGYPVYSVFDPKDLPDYASHPAHECPMCKAGQKLDAIVNCHGFSKL